MADEIQGGWTFESRDDKSELLDKLRALPRYTLPDVGDYVLASDLDAMINAAIAAPKGDA